MAVFLYFNESTLSFEVFNYLLSCLISVHSCISRIVVNNSSVVVHNVDNREIVAETYFKVVRVMCRSYLNNTCTEVHFNVIVSNDRYFTVNERKYDHFANEVLVTLISRIYCYSSIAEECLRTCCSELKIIV